MQTFLPYPDFKQSAQVLDQKRLGNQRNEAKILINSLENGGGWSRHPACRMWEGRINGLKRYHDVIVQEWVNRGYNNSMPLYRPRVYSYPSWFGDPDFHAAHRSQLLGKNPVYYEQFGWKEPPGLIPYVWPITPK